MAIDETTEVLPSVLDRLTADDTNHGEIGARQPQDTIEGSIMRNLEMILNTRREEFLVPAEFEQTASSIVNFGIPDLSGCGSLALTSEQTKLCRWIEEAIRNFEPRLRNVAVRVLDKEKVTPVLRFRVEAKAEFSARRIGFDMGLRRDSGELVALPGSLR